MVSLPAHVEASELSLTAQTRVWAGLDRVGPIIDRMPEQEREAERDEDRRVR